MAAEGHVHPGHRRTRWVSRNRAMPAHRVCRGQPQAQWQLLAVTGGDPVLVRPGPGRRVRRKPPKPVNACRTQALAANSAVAASSPSTASGGARPQHPQQGRGRGPPPRQRSGRAPARAWLSSTSTGTCVAAFG
ncbi:hypothetical protein BC739_002652 [Kutzneria viridogrisea]|uniref:Uncharacterized protein n=1 Tax=Kutzneria viridogrisea TaxID=47990 RepID=A0ABR6BEZ9_9PSEU|nr:hypothetical protein [Kutzneria viridogrisea]